VICPVVKCCYDDGPLENKFCTT